MNPTHFLTQIRQLIAEDELSTALMQLRKLLEHSPKLDDAIIQSARFQDVRRQIRTGSISTEDANLTQNQIRLGLLELVREIEEQGEKEEIKDELQHAISIVNSKNVVAGSTITARGNVVIGDTTHTESEGSRRLRMLMFVFVPLLAIAAAIFWYQYQKMQEPLSLKIRIENQSPNSELPDPVGSLSLTYGQKTETKENVSVEALFEGIPPNVGGENVRLVYEAKGFLKVDSSFALEYDLINLPITRNQDLAELSGLIINEEGQGLEGVKISISGCCYTLTQADGSFLLEIPIKFQRTHQRLELSLDGYASRSISTPIIPGEPMRTFMQKSR